MQKLFLALSFFLAFSVSSQAQNLFQNGSFKNGLSGWKLSTDSQKEINLSVSSDYQAFGLTDNHVGMNFVHLNSLASLEQTLNTQVGESYIVGFGFSHLPQAGDKQIIITIDNKPVYTYTIKNTTEKGRFQHRHFTFKAQNASTNIRIYVASIGGDDKKGILFTDVMCDVEAEADLKLYYSY